MLTHSRWITRLAALAITSYILALGPEAGAVVSVSSCGTTCSSACQLAGNITCQESQNGVTLTNGATLDMRGFDIICAASDLPEETCGTAVIISGPSSVVFSSSSADPGDPTPRIVGTWIRGVNCQGNAGSRVTGITLRGNWHSAGISGCFGVDENVLAGLTLPLSGGPDQFPSYSPYGIFHTSISNGDFIAGNYIDGCKRAIARSASGASTQVSIAYNVINHRNYEPGLFGKPAIDLLAQTPKPALVDHNIFVGDSVGALIAHNGTNASYTNNICKFPLAGCAACVSSGRCVANGTTTSP